MGTDSSPRPVHRVHVHGHDGAKRRARDGNRLYAHVDRVSCGIVSYVLHDVGKERLYA